MVIQKEFLQPHTRNAESQIHHPTQLGRRNRFIFCKRIKTLVRVRLLNTTSWRVQDSVWSNINIIQFSNYLMTALRRTNRNVNWFIHNQDQISVSYWVRCRNLMRLSSQVTCKYKKIKDLSESYSECRPVDSRLSNRSILKHEELVTYNIIW